MKKTAQYHQYTKNQGRVIVGQQCPQRIPEFLKCILQEIGFFANNDGTAHEIIFNLTQANNTVLSTTSPP